jgi:hypothetical protein
VKELKSGMKKLIILRHNKGLQEDLRDMVTYLTLLGLVYLSVIVPSLVIIDEIKYLKATLPFVKPHIRETI